MSAQDAYKDGLREFQILRFNILMLPSRDDRHRFSSSDLFAWSSRTFPIFSISTLHEGFEEFFHPSKEMMIGLSRTLGDAFHSDKQPPTVYDLESDLGVNRGDSPWTRSDLIRALRYMSLCDDRFTPEFWRSMIRDSGAPAEANSFFSPFDPLWDADPH